ncbi:unnamed protein product [Cuscuta campestris]|uniref:Uncharacterized protein n=1 Tax=Cuscuta campestris TaxID=132261 RepID=A0A484LJI3_9ASTE|nr:unnamed protein product [Cuscuta campestris]
MEQGGRLPELLQSIRRTLEQGGRLPELLQSIRRTLSSMAGQSAAQAYRVAPGFTTAWTKLSLSPALEGRQHCKVASFLANRRRS